MSGSLISSKFRTKCSIFLQNMSVPQYDISLTVALLVGSPLPSGKRFGKANVGKMEVSKSLKVPLEYPINLLMSNKRI